MRGLFTITTIMNGSGVYQSHNATTLIDRLNGLITATLQSTSFTQAQRIELIKLFQITINMISQKQQKSPNIQLSHESIQQYSKLIDSFQNLINANRANQLLKNNLSMLSTKNISGAGLVNTNRKFGIFYDRMSNLSPPSISTNSVYDVESHKLFIGKVNISQQLDEETQLKKQRDAETRDEDDDSGSEFDEEEEENDIYNSTALLIPSPQRHALSIEFPDNRLTGLNYHGDQVTHSRISSLYSLP